jgi:hypothetical protein
MDLLALRAFLKPFRKILPVVRGDALAIMGQENQRLHCSWPDVPKRKMEGYRHHSIIRL